MSLRLYAAATLFVGLGAVIAAAEYDDAAHYRYALATVTEVTLKGCDVKNEKHRIIYRNTISLSGVDCDRAEMLIGYDPDLAGGDVTYHYEVKARYVDPADGATRVTDLSGFPARFVTPVGGQVLIRAHKTRAGKVNKGRWTENLSLTPSNV